MRVHQIKWSGTTLYLLSGTVLYLLGKRNSFVLAHAPKLYRVNAREKEHLNRIKIDPVQCKHSLKLYTVALLFSNRRLSFFLFLRFYSF